MALAEKESRTVGRVTEITHLVPFKKGGPRGSHGIRYADRCRIVLDAFDDLEREGFVSPVRSFSGIHFARWTLIDGDTRLLFTTNFDGTWEDYIGDFVRKIPWSLGLIWCNCEGYPPDFTGPNGEPRAGASDHALFSRFVRHYQVPAGLFYAHYGNLGVRDIRYLQVFHQEVVAALEKPVEEGEAPTLGAIQQRSMARLQRIAAAYDGFPLPKRPFPEEECTQPMGDDERRIFMERVGVPIRRLYGYDDRQMQAVFEEFKLLGRSAP